MAIYKFKGNLDITEEIKATELAEKLLEIVKVCPNAIVTIRQTEGTDFPPFIAIESPKVHDETDEEGIAVNQLA